MNVPALICYYEETRSALIRLAQGLPDWLTPEEKEEILDLIDRDMVLCQRQIELLRRSDPRHTAG